MATKKALILPNKMKGSSGQEDYTVFAAFPSGMVGYKNLGSEGLRVRVAPTTVGDTLPFPSNWARPDKYNNRYSIVVPKSKPGGFIAALSLAVGILAAQLDN